MEIHEVEQVICGSERHAKSILVMPKRTKSMPKRWEVVSQRWKIVKSLKLYAQLYKKLLEVEAELNKIQKECVERTSCFLRYAHWSPELYAPGSPHDSDAEDWQIVLSEFYAEQANQLLAKREETLKKLYAIASRVYQLRGKTEILSARFPHLRKPSFKIP
jgi:hypothetical protein